MKNFGYYLTIIAAAGMFGSCSTLTPVKKFVTNSASAVKETFVPSQKEKEEISDRVSQKFDAGKQVVKKDVDKAADATKNGVEKAIAATKEATTKTAKEVTNKTTDMSKDAGNIITTETKQIATETKQITSEATEAVKEAVETAKEKVKPSGEIVNEIYDKAVNKNSNVTPTVNVSTDTPAPNDTAVPDTTVPQNNIVAIDKIKGEWTIMSVYGEDITDDDRPYITFDKATGRFYGSNGCNIINGDLVSDKENSISFENMISTMRACQDAPHQYAINMALPQVKTFKLSDDRQETYMSLYDGSGHKVMTLRRNNMDYLNGPWTVTMLNGTSVEPGKIVMNIDLPELRVHGNAGCNLFNGELFLDPDKSCSLQFGRMASTRMTCPDIATETEFLIALESVEECHHVTGSDGAISLTNSEGVELMELIPMKVERE